MNNNIYNSEYVILTKFNRLFINLTLGCRSNCSYCYLPQIGYKNNLNKLKIKTAKEIINEINSNNLYNSKTTITLGCFSECLDLSSVKEIIKIVIFFLNQGNQIQISTKEIISEKDIIEISKHIKYKGQIIFFISCTCIKRNTEIENKTSNIYKRFINFKLLNQYNIVSCLYIKPVLKNITINDIDQFKKYIIKYNISNVIIGSIFSTEEKNEKVNFIVSKNLFYNKNDDEEIILKELAKYTKVFTRSSQVLSKYKN